MSLTEHHDLYILYSFGPFHLTIFCLLIRCKLQRILLIDSQLKTAETTHKGRHILKVFAEIKHDLLFNALII